MDKIIVATFNLRGTEKEIERVKARIASLSACEECVSLYIREKKEKMNEKEEEEEELRKYKNFWNKRNRH